MTEAYVIRTGFCNDTMNAIFLDLKEAEAYLEEAAKVHFNATLAKIKVGRPDTKIAKRIYGSRISIRDGTFKDETEKEYGVRYEWAEPDEESHIPDIALFINRLKETPACYFSELRAWSYISYDHAHKLLTE